MLMLPFFLLKCRFKNIAATFLATSLVQLVLCGMIRYFSTEMLWLRFLANMVIYGVIVFTVFKDEGKRKTAVYVSGIILLVLEEVITGILMKG